MFSGITLDENGPKRVSPVKKIHETGERDPGIVDRERDKRDRQRRRQSLPFKPLGRPRYRRWTGIIAKKLVSHQIHCLLVAGIFAGWLMEFLAGLVSAAKNTSVEYSSSGW
jgi:hypothetical protein